MHFMIKRIAGGAIIAAATLLATYPTQNLSDIEKLPAVNQLGEGQTSDFLENVTADLPSSLIQIRLIETIDGDTIKVLLNGKIEIV